MSNMTLKKTLDLTLKLILALLAEPRANARMLASSLGMSEAWVNKMTGDLRGAGLNVAYDRNKGEYNVGLSDDLKRSLDNYARRLRKVVHEAKLYQPATRVVPSLERYDIRQFADYMGTSQPNVYNMISGWKGQHLPAGWVAYQITAGGKWFIQKMIMTKSGKPTILPQNVKEAYTYKIGDGKPMQGNVDGVDIPLCRHKGCDTDGGKPGRQLAKGLCTFHYYQARRHPERFPELKTASR